MKNSETRSPLDLSAISYVQEQISRTLPGCRLPGLRQMIRDSQLGRIRLEKALHYWQSAGKITILPQSGCYRCAEIETAAIVFIAFSPHTIEENNLSFIGGAMLKLRQLAAENGQQMELLNAYNMPLAELQTVLEQRKYRQAFVWGAASLNIIKMIRRCIPFTISLHPNYQSKYTCELRDSPYMTEMQMKYLFQCNYQNIAYIHNSEADWTISPIQHQRLFDYYRIMAENGLRVESEWVFFCAYNWEIFQKSMHKLINCRRRPDAVIVPGSTLQYLYRFCSNNGIIIGKELAVISSDNTNSDLDPAPTCVTNSPAESGEQAWQIMQQCLQGFQVQEYTRLRIITGSTLPHRDKIYPPAK